MPIYSYICKDCRERFDLFAGIGGKDEKLVCKKCKSKNIEKTFSSFGVGSSVQKGRSEAESSCSTGTCPFS